jgi:hypothetical protein
MLIQQMEKNTQDEALSDLSNVLGQLKGMTLEMGHEIERSVTFSISTVLFRYFL